MKQFFNNKKGFIAIETIITAGLMIGLAGFGLGNFLDVAVNVSDHANGLVESVSTLQTPSVQ